MLSQGGVEGLVAMTAYVTVSLYLVNVCSRIVTGWCGGPGSHDGLRHRLPARGAAGCAQL